MKNTPFLAAIFMALAVSAGAFGAHALRNVVSSGDLAIWDKAVFYHAIHAMAVLCIALSSTPNLPQTLLRVITTLFLVSIVIFSGSLYLLVLSQQRWLGMITPLGGTGFIVGWLLLAYDLRRRKTSV